MKSVSARSNRGREWARPIVGLAVLALVASAEARDRNPCPASLNPLQIQIRMTLSAAKELKAKDLEFANFPNGKRCAFTYFGPKSTKTISYLTGLGFRTTMYVSPGTDAGRIQGYEKAGAEIAVNPWGCKGSWLSTIGSNTYQECYDASVTSRKVIETKTTKPILLIHGSSSKAGTSFMYRRNPDDHAGFGFAFHDANYLCNSGLSQGYNILLGRERRRKQVFKEKFKNTMKSNKVPNEIVYYRIIANWFRGTLQRTEAGQVVLFSLRDFKEKDLKSFGDIAGEWGKHEQVWHATEGEIVSNEYLKKKTKVVDAKVNGNNEAVVTLAVERGTFQPFIRTPLCIQLPKDFPLKSAKAGGIECPITRNKDGLFMDVPLPKVIGDGCRMSLKTERPDMTIPEEMKVSLTVENASDKPLKGAKLEWVNSIGITVTGGTDAAFDLGPNEKKTIEAVVKTTSGLPVGDKFKISKRGRIRASLKPTGARFGLAPIQAVVKGKVGDVERTFVSGFEILVAPRIRIEFDPMQRFPIAKGRVQPVIVRLMNGKQASKFISSRAGPCKGVVTFELPDGLEAQPKEQAFDLKENDTARLIFHIKNTKWAEELSLLKPVVKFEGEDQPVATVFPGVLIERSEKMQYKPLDDKGLTLYASWDHPEDFKGNRADVAVNKRNRGSMVGQYGGEYNYHSDGKRGWCINSKMEGFGDPYQTLDYQKGTVTFWMRRDPRQKNENQMRPDRNKTWKSGYAEGYEPGELLFGVSSCQYIAKSSKSDICLKRFPGWDGKKGYLEAVYTGMNQQKHYVQVDFDWSDEWRHIGLLWDMKAKRLEIYINGKLAGKADPGKEEWLGSPWDRGRSEVGASGTSFSFGSKDHGKVALTLRDELHIYDRCLSVEDIVANMKAVDGPKKTYKATAQKPSKK